MKLDRQHTTRSDVIYVVLWMGLNTIFGGVVLSSMWKWFVATPFGVSTINIPQALGLMMLIRASTPGSDAIPATREHPYVVEVMRTYHLMVAYVVGLLAHWVM